MHGIVDSFLSSGQTAASSVMLTSPPHSPPIPVPITARTVSGSLQHLSQHLGPRHHRRVPRRHPHALGPPSHLLEHVVPRRTDPSTLAHARTHAGVCKGTFLSARFYVSILESFKIYFVQVS